MANAICQVCCQPVIGRRGSECGSCYYKRRPRVPCGKCGNPSGRQLGDERGRTKLPICLTCRRADPSSRKNPSITEWFCATCGTHCTRLPTKGQTPKYCADCSNGKQSLKAKTCAHCRKTFKASTTATKHCEACSKIQVWKAVETQWKQCDWCLSLHDTMLLHCSKACKRRAAADRAKSNRGPLRAAVEDGNHDAVISIIKGDVQINSDGCWIWTRKMKRGYPIANAGRMVLVHRIVLEAKHGKRLGSQAAHHICANTLCVNPDHLQPVTHRDNIAEMLARHSYLNYIAELREVVAELAPDHPILAVIEVA